MDKVILCLKKIGEWLGPVASILDILSFFGIDYKKIKQIILLISAKFKTFIGKMKIGIIIKYRKIRKLFEQYLYIIKMMKNTISSLKILPYLGIYYCLFLTIIVMQNPIGDYYNDTVVITRHFPKLDIEEKTQNS